MTSFFSKEIHYDFLVDPVLDNIPKIPTRISAMILGVVILIEDFSLSSSLLGS